MKNSKIMRFGLTTRQVIRLLKESRDNYIHHYLQWSTVHNREGDDIGRFSFRVYDHLVRTGLIERFALSDEVHSDGYFKLKSSKSFPA